MGLRSTRNFVTNILSVAYVTPILQKKKKLVVFICGMKNFNIFATEPKDKQFVSCMDTCFDKTKSG